MSTPGVGKPSEEYRAVCQYTGPADADPPCGEPATVHVLTADAVHDLVTLTACGRHADIARRAGQHQDEHKHQGVCGLPGTVWVVEGGRCEIDDSGIEPELAGARELELAR